MTGVLNAMVGGPTPERIVVTVGNASSQYGFNSVAGIGSISPGTYKGYTIRVIASDVSFDFSFDFLGSGLVQTLFRYVVVESTAGTARRFDAADAVFTPSSSPDSAQWTWGSGSNKVWTATTPSPRTVLIYA